MAATLKSLALHGQSSTIYTLKTEKHILYMLCYIILYAYGIISLLEKSAFSPLTFRLKLVA